MNSTSKPLRAADSTIASRRSVRPGILTTNIFWNWKDVSIACSIKIRHHQKPTPNVALKTSSTRVPEVVAVGLLRKLEAFSAACAGTLVRLTWNNNRRKSKVPVIAMITGFDGLRDNICRGIFPSELSGMIDSENKKTCSTHRSLSLDRKAHDIEYTTSRYRMKGRCRNESWHQLKKALYRYEGNCTHSDESLLDAAELIHPGRKALWYSIQSL